MQIVTAFIFMETDLILNKHLQISGVDVIKDPPIP